MSQTVTYGVPSTGNVQALLMSLATVLQQERRPEKILIRMEGEYPAFGSFYFEQIAALARILGVEFTITTDKSQGIRYARDWLIDNTTTDLLWMGDDDVLYAPHCLKELLVGYADAGKMSPGTVAYVNGNKPDVNNRRGYDNFEIEFRDSAKTKENEGYNFFFKGKGKTVRCNTCDTGNLLISVTRVRGDNIRFQAFAKSWNCSGDDSLFAIMCHANGLHGFFRTRADSYHLEKPNVRFNEFAARKTMLLRECELLKVDPKCLETVLPWLKM